MGMYFKMADLTEYPNLFLALQGDFVKFLVGNIIESEQKL